MKKVEITLPNGTCKDIVYVWYDEQGQQHTTYTPPTHKEHVGELIQATVIGPRAAQSMEELHRIYFRAALQAAKIVPQF